VTLQAPELVPASPPSLPVWLDEELHAPAEATARTQAEHNARADENFCCRESMVDLLKLVADHFPSASVFRRPGAASAWLGDALKLEEEALAARPYRPGASV
jgi:hypothetical protein